MNLTIRYITAALLVTSVAACMASCNVLDEVTNPGPRDRRAKTEDARGFESFGKVKRYLHKQGFPKNHMDTDALLQAYRLHAQQFGEAIEPDVVNQAHAELLAVREALRDSGQAMRILELLADESEDVRLWAGFDALHLSPEDGLRVLQALAEGPRSKASYEARMTLWVRERGQLVLVPWEDDES